jgi:hypothetical protein
MNAENYTNEQAQGPTLTTHSRRRTGKIARLPRKLRELINHLLDEGTPYTQIITALQQSTEPLLPYSISVRNISNWHDGGYQDWVQHQEQLQLAAAKFDLALKLARGEHSVALEELPVHLATVRICEFLSKLALVDVTDPAERAAYLRLLSLLPRITKAAAPYMSPSPVAKTSTTQSPAPTAQSGPVTQESIPLPLTSPNPTYGNLRKV